GVVLNIANIVNFTGQGIIVITPAGLAAKIDGSITINVGAAFGFEGTFSVAINNGTVAVHETLAVGTQTLTLDLPAGPYIRVEGTNIKLTIAGQSLTGNFAFEKLTSTS